MGKDILKNSCERLSDCNMYLKEDIITQTLNTILRKKMWQVKLHFLGDFHPKISRPRELREPGLMKSYKIVGTHRNPLCAFHYTGWELPFHLCLVLPLFCLHLECCTLEIEEERERSRRWVGTVPLLSWWLPDSFKDFSPPKWRASLIHWLLIVTCWFFSILIG